MSEQVVDPGHLEELGRRLESRRRELGKSAREVALNAGISPVYLRVIETGRNSKTGRASRPSAEVIVHLARELELEPDDLLGLANYHELRVDNDARRSADATEAPQALAAPGDVQRIAAAVELAQTRPSDFMRQLLADDLRRFEAHVSAIAAGSLLCGSADDGLTRKRAMREACGRSLHSVSLGDDAWWLDDAAKGYVELHHQLAAREPAPEMIRIFLLMPAEHASYRPIAGLLVAAGVRVYVASPMDVPDTCRRDFEIFDGSLLREAVSSDSRLGRLAEFTDDHPRLQRAEAAFDTVFRASTAFSGTVSGC